MRLSSICAAITAASLAGCGGGGGSSTATTTTTAEGAYQGTLTNSTSNAFELVVLEDGTYWALYGTSVSGGLGVAGFIQGTGSSSSTTFSSSNGVDFGLDPVGAVNVSASYTASSIHGTATENGGTVTIDGAPIPSATYDYNTPAKLSDIQGSWSMTATDGSFVSLTVSGGGAFTGTTSGCNFSGTLSPRASGKNVFNMQVSFDAATCGAAVTASGIAIDNVLSGTATRQLIVLGTDSARTSGFALFGTR